MGVPGCLRWGPLIDRFGPLVVCVVEVVDIRRVVEVVGWWRWLR